MSLTDSYETVVGLEVHVQLLTQSKLFCSDPVSSGEMPNEHTSAVSLAHPGTLPMMNKKAIELAVKMGLACGSTIEKNNYFARKNYFYPDLPKGYQVTQHTAPICLGGQINIGTAEEPRIIRINRIHLEEDAGKSIHDADENYTCLDFNRAGVALIEIVTEPDLRTGEEAAVLLTEIRKLVRYLDISDGNMEEGNLRCDANISVRKKGEPKLGTKVEIKNLNSIRFARKAIGSESLRMMDMLKNGETILQQTRGFDPETEKTFAIRDKEEADDYRYFPEPDLAPFHFTETYISEIKKTMPALPAARLIKYRDVLHLSDYDATLLSEEKEFSDYFERLITRTNAYKAAANWMLGPVRSWLNQQNRPIAEFPLEPEKIAAIISLVEENKLNFSSASTRLFSQLVINTEKDPALLASELNLMQESDALSLEPLIRNTLEKFSDKVMEYKKGKKGILALLVGDVIRQSKGKADPKRVNELLLEKLNTSVK
jgi:aspartyl-tRNA(Asn)/glutamyl-tRNA(Gln) amidotransferase subunit B